MDLLVKNARLLENYLLLMYVFSFFIFFPHRNILLIQMAYKCIYIHIFSIYYNLYNASHKYTVEIVNVQSDRLNKILIIEQLFIKS